MALRPRDILSFTGTPPVSPVAGALAAMQGFRGVGQSQQLGTYRQQIEEMARHNRALEAQRAAELEEAKRATMVREGAAEEQLTLQRKRMAHAIRKEARREAMMGNLEVARKMEGQARALEGEVARDVLKDMPPIEPDIKAWPEPAAGPEQPTLPEPEEPELPAQRPTPDVAGMPLGPSIMAAAEPGPVPFRTYVGETAVAGDVARQPAEIDADSVARDLISIAREQPVAPLTMGDLPYGMTPQGIEAQKARMAGVISGYLDTLEGGPVSPEVVQRTSDATRYAIEIAGGNYEQAMSYLSEWLGWEAQRMRTAMGVEPRRRLPEGEKKPVVPRVGPRKKRYKPGDRMREKDAWQRVTSLGKSLEVPEYTQMNEQARGANAKIAEVRRLLAEDPNAQVGATVNQIIYNLGKANDKGGRLSDRDVEMAEGIKSILQRIEDFVKTSTEAAKSEETLSSLETAARQLLSHSSDALRRRYARLRRFGESWILPEERRASWQYVETMFGMEPWYAEDVAALDAQYGGSLYSGPIGTRARGGEEAEAEPAKELKDLPTQRTDEEEFEDLMR